MLKREQRLALMHEEHMAQADPARVGLRHRIMADRMIAGEGSGQLVARVTIFRLQQRQGALAKPVGDRCRIAPLQNARIGEIPRDVLGLTAIPRLPAARHRYSDFAGNIVSGEFVVDQPQHFKRRDENPEPDQSVFVGRAAQHEQIRLGNRHDIARAVDPRDAVQEIDGFSIVSRPDMTRCRPP